MTLRHRSAGELEGEVLKRSAEAARGNMLSELTHLRRRFGFDEAHDLALEKAQSNPPESQGILQEVRHVTSEAILMYERRGYSVRQIGEKFEEALGDQQFRGGILSEEETPADVVNTVFDIVNETWKLLERNLATQAEGNARTRIVSPESEETAEERVTREMRAVWAKKAEDVRLGSRTEDFRAGVGLRTLSAIIQRYRSMDARGREDAMPCAYAWADRAYWLTKYGIKALGERYPGERETLNALGAGFEETLGESSLARGGLETPPDTRGWEIITPARDKINETWRKIKDNIPKES